MNLIYQNLQKLIVKAAQINRDIEILEYDIRSISLQSFDDFGLNLEKTIFYITEIESIEFFLSINTLKKYIDENNIEIQTQIFLSVFAKQSNKNISLRDLPLEIKDRILRNKRTFLDTIAKILEHIIK